MAAMLARAMADLEREQYELRAEGSVMTSERGTPVVNPRKTVVQMHAGTILSMRRRLSLHARAQQGEARDAGKRRAAAKEMADQSHFGDRKSVVEGTSGSVRVDLGGRRLIKKKKKTQVDE